MICWIVLAFIFGGLLSWAYFRAEVKILTEENEMLKEDLLDCKDGHGKVY